MNQKKFSLDGLDHSDNNLLHLAVSHPNLSVMHRILKSYNHYAFKLNNELKIPMQLISRNFLTSRKLLYASTKLEIKYQFSPTSSLL